MDKRRLQITHLNVSIILRCLLKHSFLWASTAPPTFCHLFILVVNNIFMWILKFIIHWSHTKKTNNSVKQSLILNRIILYYIIWTQQFHMSECTHLTFQKYSKVFPTWHKTDTSLSHICSSSNNKSKVEGGGERARKRAESSNWAPRCIPLTLSQWNPSWDRPLLPRRWCSSTTPSGLRIDTNCWKTHSATLEAIHILSMAQ